MTAPGSEAPRPPRPSDVAVVVLTHDGRDHLPACLEAVLGLEGLNGPEAVVVVDNASADGSRRLVAERFPGVRQLAFTENLGFAGGYDRALAQLEAPWTLLLNDDTAIEPPALRRLCAALDDGGVCAGARLLSWRRRHLDFDGGAASWTGHGHALGHGERRPQGEPEPQPRGTLFCSGAAMLIHRPTFLALGGFDPRYFAYYEDVDLGWRMHLRGLEPLHVPRAIVRHKGGGTASTLTTTRRARMHERNALRTAVKCWGDRVLARALPAALALAAVRQGASLDVLEEAARAAPWHEPRGSTGEGSATGLPLPLPLPLPPAAWSGWRWLAPLELDVAAWPEARRAVQEGRRRTDREMVARLGRPWAPVPADARGYRALERACVAFDLEAVLGPRPGPEYRGLAERVGRAWRTGGARGLARAARGWWHGRVGRQG